MLIFNAAIFVCCLSAVAYSNEDFILVTDTQMNSIYQVNVTSGQKTLLPVGNVSRPFALDYDNRNDYIYWTEDGKILQSHRNGTGRRELLDTNITAGGIVLDLAGHNIFWTDIGRKTISAARIDGSYQRTLISTYLDRPRAIVLQSSNGYMYWTDCGDEPKIERAAMDGTGRTTLINTRLGKPTGLAIDFKEHVLYWCDAGDPYHRLEKSDLLGNNRRVVVSYPNTQFLGIAVDDGNIYWTAKYVIKLARTSEANTGLRVAIGSGYGVLNGIHLHKHGVSTDVTNACSSYNGGCHHLCLALPGGRTCACRDGWVLRDDESTCTPPDVRLVGGSSHHEGRVEIRHHHEWRTVCDDKWNNDSARVVCRQLGYPDAAEAKGAAYFGQESGTIGLDDVQCTGNETSLFECEHRGWGVSNCGHQEDAGVICLLDVRLVRGGSAYQGRVEVLHGGVWGTVCDRGWDVRDTDVVCRQLGYLEAATAEKAAAFGEGTGPIWMDDATCTGYETSLTKCGHAGWNTSNCDHGQDAGVICQLLAVRLVDGNSPNEGRVEVFYQGKWGTVCDDGWDLKDASVVCRRLGYPNATSALDRAHFGEGSGPIWLDDLVCEGDESGLSECGHSGLGVVNCGHHEDAGVVCAPPSDYTLTTTATTSTTPGTTTSSIPAPDKQTGILTSNTVPFIITTALSATFALVGVVTLVLSFCVLRRRKTVKKRLQRAISNDYQNTNPAFCIDDNPIYCTAGENTYDVVGDRPTPHEKARDLPTPHGGARDRPTPHDGARDRPNPHDGTRDLPTPRGKTRDLPVPHDAVRNRRVSSAKQEQTEDEKTNVYVDMSAKFKVYENSVSI
ncbi:uncharacterized protein LOC144883781 isoform X2 [Branchiostoma floridae x Branchiostoma japonicum]